MIYPFNGVNELDMEGRVQLVNMMTAGDVELASVYPDRPS